jgi:hypothetical protein
MGKHFFHAVAIGAALALIFTASALAKREVVQVGNLFLADNGGISPTKLPRNEQAPISAHIHGEIGTTDGSHPPAVKTVTVDFDKTIQVNAKGLPACKPGNLEARTTAAAKKACPDAIVGSGEGEVEVAFPEQAPLTAKGPIVIFNGGVHGGTTTLFIHTYVAIRPRQRSSSSSRSAASIVAISASTRWQRSPKSPGAPARPPSSSSTSVASSPTRARRRASSPPVAPPGATTPKGKFCSATAQRWG